MPEPKPLAFFYREFETVAALVEAEFARNLERFRDHLTPDGKRGLQCRRGCNACCSHLFEITPLEAAYIARHVRTLPADEQRRLRERAAAYRIAREKLLDARARELKAQHIEGKLPVVGLRLPCPALGDDGSCTIYDARPLTCRKFGMPLYDPRRPGLLGACELNFKNGDALDAEGIVAHQTRIHNRWESMKAAFGTEYSLNPNPGELTVADALFTDHDAAFREEK